MKHFLQQSQSHLPWRGSPFKGANARGKWYPQQGLPNMLTSRNVWGEGPPEVRWAKLVHVFSILYLFTVTWFWCLNKEVLNCNSLTFVPVHSWIEWYQMVAATQPLSRPFVYHALALGPINCFHGSQWPEVVSGWSHSKGTGQHPIDLQMCWPVLAMFSTYPPTPPSVWGGARLESCCIRFETISRVWKPAGVGVCS